MRIIAGSARGTRLVAPKGQGTRPTPDMVREALFNIIAAKTPSAEFLDLFAGTGAVGLEALSRGARFAVFADMSAESVSCIKRNAEKTGLLDRARIIRADASRALGACVKDRRLFDVVYIDPPYGKGLAIWALGAVASHGLLRQGGMAVTERGGDDLLEPDFLRAVRDAGLGDVYECVKERKYGGTVLSFFTKL